MSTLTRTQKVTGVAAAVSAALAGYTTTQAQLEEIVVTATKKTENLQDGTQIVSKTVPDNANSKKIKEDNLIEKIFIFFFKIFLSSVIK